MCSGRGICEQNQGDRRCDSSGTDVAAADNARCRYFGATKNLWQLKQTKDMGRKCNLKRSRAKVSRNGRSGLRFAVGVAVLIGLLILWATFADNAVP